MTRHPYTFPIEVLGLAAAVLLSSACSKSEEEKKAPLPLSDTEIVVDLSEEWTPVVQSRADLFKDQTVLFDESKGGGNFTLYAYIDGSGETFLGGAHAWHFVDEQAGVRRWVFLDGNGRLITYYWPNSEGVKVDFFAFMPDSRYEGDMYGSVPYQSKETCITLPDRNTAPYTDAEGPTFSCSLPEAVSNAPADKKTAGYVLNSDIGEFIYAYEPDRVKTNEAVEMHFKHPLALINFELAMGSYRMNIDRIEISNIYLEGKFSVKTGENGKWTPAPGVGRKTFAMEIKKNIPPKSEDDTEGENYNTPLDDPFLVMPQDLAGTGATLTLYYTRGDDEEINHVSAPLIPEVSEGDATAPSVSTEWEPGRQYTYRIAFGDNNAEIYFGVSSTEWIPSGETNIEVE